MTEPAKKKGRPSRKLDINTLGGKIRYLREEVFHLNTETLGNFVGVTNQQISNAEQELEKVITGTYKVGEKERKGYSDQLIFALAHELGSDFEEPEIRAHLILWMERMLRIWFGGNDHTGTVSDMPPQQEPIPSD